MHSALELLALAFSPVFILAVAFEINRHVEARARARRRVLERLFYP